MIYAIGDLQGCFQSLLGLLDAIDFDRARDRLWFVGDLVNRGPQSLEVLRYIRGLGEAAETVLGNHDLHLLAVAYGGAALKRKDTLQAILDAPDCEELLTWLRSKPLLGFDDDTETAIVHAGIPPIWDFQQARLLAREVEKALRGPGFRNFLKAMYGSQPECWSSELEGDDRLRYIVNAFTRMRYCQDDGTLDMRSKGPPGTQPTGFQPWFESWAKRGSPNRPTVAFGHWASLRLSPARARELGTLHTDTGCVWGDSLTAVSLHDHCFVSVPSIL